MEEANMVELPYYRDSREEYLNTAYSYCDLDSYRENDDDDDNDVA